MTDTEVQVPREAQNQFDAFEGIPLDVIAELFGRANTPKDVQSAFWIAAAVKTVKTISGYVRITTNRDGSTEVNVLSKDGKNQETFRGDDLTSDQLGEMKRAQGARLTVGVGYQVEGSKLPVNFVTVFEADEDGKKEDNHKEENKFFF